ncbi:MAG TPA: hypothetical protein VKO83_06820, partial [Steroidobacteraceae bacterium]|nr:hypothetical protein [Steroidobacteraceae bacterium]
MLRDTSAQDQILEPRARGWLKRRGPLLGALAALVAATAWVAVQWLSGTRSFDAEQLRIATVSRGDLVRDITADGRVIAANSPTLYAIAAGTVALKIVAG